jgi:hypothetical protein
MPQFLPLHASQQVKRDDVGQSSNPFEELYQSYRDNALRYAETLQALTPKKIFAFKSAKIPPSLAEKNIGLILMTLIAAFVDN